MTVTQNLRFTRIADLACALRHQLQIAIKDLDDDYSPFVESLCEQLADHCANMEELENLIAHILEEY